MLIELEDAQEQPLRLLQRTPVLLDFEALVDLAERFLQSGVFQRQLFEPLYVLPHHLLSDPL